MQNGIFQQENDEVMLFKEIRKQLGIVILRKIMTVSERQIPSEVLLAYILIHKIPQTHMHMHTHI